MKSLWLIGSFVGLVSAGNSDGPLPLVSLTQAYGSAPEVDTLKPWESRYGSAKKPLIARGEAYKAVRTPDNCIFPINVMLVQDLTASFDDDIYQMRTTQLKLMFDALSNTHPNSTYSLTSFRDKPQWSLGNKDDFCYRLEQPFDAKSDLTTLQTEYSKLEAVGGADPAENQFGALIAACEDKAVAWPENQGTNLIVLSTDAPPHFADDGLNKYGMTPYSGHFNAEDPAGQCLKEYYPSPEQVKQAIASRNAYAAFLIFDADWWNGIPKGSWEWFNNYIGQTKDFLNPLANDASNFWDLLAAVIKKIEEAECVEDTTTTTSQPTTKTNAVDTTMMSSSQEVTTAVPQTTTVSATTTESPVTPVGSTVSECAPCGPCEEDPCECECPEVMIKIRHRPSKLHLNVENEFGDTTVLADLK